MNLESLAITSLLFILPAYIANACAALFGSGKQIDFGFKLYGKPLFGKNKTWQGLAAGIFFGTAAGNVQGFLLQNTGFALGSTAFHTLLGFLLATGALLGDLAASFVKRQAGLRPGRQLPVVDQLDFVIGAMLLASLIHSVSQEQAAFLLLVTPAAHVFLNYAAYKLKCKKVPW